MIFHGAVHSKVQERKVDLLLLNWRLCLCRSLFLPVFFEFLEGEAIVDLLDFFECVDYYYCALNSDHAQDWLLEFPRENQILGSRELEQ